MFKLIGQKTIMFTMHPCTAVISVNLKNLYQEVSFEEKENCVFHLFLCHLFESAKRNIAYQGGG